MEIDMKHYTQIIFVFLVATTFLLSGCKSTSSGYSGQSLGPSSNRYAQPLGSEERSYPYNKPIFLDVAIPTIDPGFPMKNGYVDEEQLVEEDIWPEIRRLEAKRFSINIREALSKTKVFGSVQVVPNTGTSADLYIVGKIEESKATETELRITVVDATNRVWGERDFSVDTTSGFYRDAKNRGLDPNKNMYTNIARWVYTLLTPKPTSELDNIQLVKHMRYAQMYSPEAFSDYIVQDKGIYSVNALPADTDALLVRIQDYQAQDNAFLDALQENYDLFYIETNQPYRVYQKEAIALQESIKNERKGLWKNIARAAACTGIAVVAAKQDSHLGDAIATGCAIGTAFSIKGAMDNSASIAEYETTFDEVGQNLDLKVSPQVRSFEEEEIELVGTASEQYLQWRSHLLRVYQENETPNRQL